MVRSRDIRIGNYVAWHRDSNGYLKQCRDCDRLIYLKLDNDDKWRPYASWIAGDAAIGEWIFHDCVWAAQQAEVISASVKPVIAWALALPGSTLNDMGNIKEVYSVNIFQYFSLSPNNEASVYSLGSLASNDFSQVTVLTRILRKPRCGYTFFIKTSVLKRKALQVGSVVGFQVKAYAIGNEGYWLCEENDIVSLDF